MHGLEKGIIQLANYEMNPKIRSNAVSLLNAIVDDLNAGIKVWEDFKNSGKANPDSGSYGGWAGFTIEKKLFEIDLNARDKAREVSGGKSSLDDPLVVLAYKMLGESETVNEVSERAIDAMKTRIDKLNEFVGLIKNTKPAKAPAVDTTIARSTDGKSNKRKGDKSKSGKSKKQKPPKKPVSKKKTTTKAKKKAAAKPSAKKTAGKKAVKKSSAKKKVARKSLPKKKASTKKAASKKSTKKAKRR